MVKEAGKEEDKMVNKRRDLKAHTEDMGAASIAEHGPAGWRRRGPRRGQTSLSSSTSDHC